MKMKNKNDENEVNGNEINGMAINDKILWRNDKIK